METSSLNTHLFSISYKNKTQWHKILSLNINGLSMLCPVPFRFVFSPSPSFHVFPFFFLLLLHLFLLFIYSLFFLFILLFHFMCSLFLFSFSFSFFFFHIVSLVIAKTNADFDDQTIISRYLHLVVFCSLSSFHGHKQYHEFSANWVNFLIFVLISFSFCSAVCCAYAE